MQTAICDRRGPYVAVLTADEGKPQSGGRQFDVLRTFIKRKRSSAQGMRVSARS